MQIVISLNALLAGRQMIIANDSGQFLTNDGWQTLGPAFAIEAVSPEDCMAQLKDLIVTFWNQIEADAAKGNVNEPDPYYQSPNVV